jgi:hypothetical protein
MGKIASEYGTRELKKTPHTKWLTTSMTTIQTAASFCSCVKYVLKALYYINKNRKQKIRQQQRRVSFFCFNGH